MNAVLLLRRKQHYAHTVARRTFGIISCHDIESTEGGIITSSASTTANKTTTRSLCYCSYYSHHGQYRTTTIGMTHAVGRRFQSTAAAAEKDSNANGSSNCSFAAVDHGKAYEESMKGWHGKQLALAELEGFGKDDPPFDPFSDDEEEDEDDDYFYDDDDDDDGDEQNDVIEAEVVEKKETSSTTTTHEKNEGETQEGDDEDDYDDEEDEYDDEEDEEESSMYNHDGSLRWKKSDLAIFKAGAPSGGKFAIIQLAGYQYKVTTDDVIIVNKLNPTSLYKVGSVHTLKNEDILLMGSSHLTLVGMPGIQNAEIDLLIEEITQDKKVIVFKKRRRKHSQRKRGFRRDVTMIRILDIRLPKPYEDHYHIERKNP